MVFQNCDSYRGIFFRDGSYTYPVKYFGYVIPTGLPSIRVEFFLIFSPEIQNKVNFLGRVKIRVVLYSFVNCSLIFFFFNEMRVLFRRWDCNKFLVKLFFRIFSNFLEKKENIPWLGSYFKLV